MVISTPRLCNDMAFQPPKAPKPHAIACTPVLPAASIPSYLAAKEQEDAATDAALDELLEKGLIDTLNHLESGKALPKQRQFVGDIEIGAHAVVPKGKRIEKSAVVGGGKETLIATIAKSDGFMATEADMKRVGIRSHREVEGVKKEVERVADGKGWRLDVVETPRGKELRGVIEDGKEEDKKGDKKKGENKEKEGKEGSNAGSDDPKEEKGDSPKEAEEELSGLSEEGSDETYKEEL
jgi:protein OS-9